MAGEVLMTISKDERERAIFRSRRIALADRESDIATVMLNAAQEERDKWQSVIADKDAEISRLRAMLEQK